MSQASLFSYNINVAPIWCRYAKIKSFLRQDERPKSIRNYWLALLFVFVRASSRWFSFTLQHILRFACMRFVVVVGFVWYVWLAANIITICSPRTLSIAPLHPYDPSPTLAPLYYNTQHTTYVLYNLYLSRWFRFLFCFYTKPLLINRVSTIQFC